MPGSSPQKMAPRVSPVTSAGVQLQLSVGKSGLQLVPPTKVHICNFLVKFILLMKHSNPWQALHVNSCFIRN